MNGKQTLVAFIGVALILGNLVTNRNKRTGSSAIANAVFNAGQGDQQLQAAHAQALGVLLEGAGVFVLVIIAGLGSNAASLAVVFMVGLALVWLMTFLGAPARRGTTA